MVAHEILAEFLSTPVHITSDNDSLVGILSHRICFCAHAIEAYTFNSLGPPFLHVLIESAKNSTSMQDRQQIFAAALKAYLCWVSS
jgi:hypothetical protein